MNISQKSKFLIIVFILINNCQSVCASPLYFPFITQNFLFKNLYQQVSTYFDTHQYADEICDNGIDDDNDGLIDAFDNDCQCIQTIDTLNLVPNGNFEETMGCCSTLDVINCLENWIMTGPSPDFVSDNCPDADLRPDVRVLSNRFNTTFNAGYIFSLFSQVDGEFYNETMGVCLSEPMISGTTYSLSFDMGNLRNDSPDILFTMIGVYECDELSNYRTQIRNSFCDSGLPYEQLGAVNTNTLSSGWNTYEFEVTPSTDIEAIFYSTDCDYQPEVANSSLMLVLDNIKIQKKVNVPLENEILVDGNPCEETLRFTVQEAENLAIHWFKDSLPLVRTTGGSLIFSPQMLEKADGIYHAKVTFEDGSCQLVGPLVYKLEEEITSDESLTLCEGETYLFGTFRVTSPGKYTQTFSSADGCDSVATISVSYLKIDAITIFETITNRESYFFNEENLNISGTYRDTLKNINDCDSIIILTLTVTNIIVEICDNLIDDDGDGLIDIFDDDCQCNQTIDTMNLVPNGDFELNQQDCCTSSVAGENICVDAWTHKSGTPDFIHPDCFSEITPALEDFFGVPLDQSFFGILINHPINILPDSFGLNLAGMTSETIGLCLSESLILGETYTISLDMALKGNLQETVLTEDIFFTVNGVPNCDSLPNYIPKSGFCESGLPYEQLASVNLFTLTSGWNHFEFEFTPTTGLEAIFVAGDCDLVPQNFIGAIALFDNLKIQKKEKTNIPNEIKVEGNPCSETFRLSVKLEQNATYQWYIDSLPIIGAEANILMLHSSIAAINSIYHLAIIDNNGNCQLIPKEIKEPLVITAEENIRLCEGDSYQIGTTIINTVGEHRFTQALTTTSGSCDSIVTVIVNIFPNTFFSFSDTINEGVFYNFGGINLSEAGVFQNTISNSQDCDSIITLNLFVRPAPSFFSYSEAICQGETLPFAGKTLTNPGIYRDTLVNFAGVDSFITLTLRVIPIATFSFEKELCVGEIYPFGDTLLTTSGQYIQSFKTLSFGCDSLVRLNIYFLEPVQGDTLSVSQFQGTTYTFHGNTYTESGIYETTITANSGCDSIAYLDLTFTDPCAIPFEISIESTDTDCEAASNGWLELIAAGNPPYRYSIDNGLNFSENPLFENLSVGNYDVVVIDHNACESSSQASIQIGTSNLFVRLPNDTSLFEGQSIQLAIEEINFEPTAYHWSADTRINCPTCPSILLNLPFSEILTLRVTDDNGCQTAAEIFIEIKKVPQLYIPNAFSPNSDGNNDYFKIEGKPETLTQIEEIQIFNRWGNLVFYRQQTDNQSTIEWDGYIHNKKAMEDVYIYIVKWVNPKGEAEVLRGDFMLFR